MFKRKLWEVTAIGISPNPFMITCVFAAFTEAGAARRMKRNQPDAWTISTREI